MNFESDDQKKIMDHLMTFFKHDIHKVMTWLLTENTQLGTVAPIVIIRCGRSDLVLQHLNQNGVENK